jgi:hypothetical protein
MFVARVLVVCCLFGGVARALTPKYHQKLAKTTEAPKVLLSSSTVTDSPLSNVTKPVSVKKPINYCDPSLCFPGVKHIGCNNRNVGVRKAFPENF